MSIEAGTAPSPQAAPHDEPESLRNRFGAAFCACVHCWGAPKWLVKVVAAAVAIICGAVSASVGLAVSCSDVSNGLAIGVAVCTALMAAFPVLLLCSTLNETMTFLAMGAQLSPLAQICIMIALNAELGKCGVVNATIVIFTIIIIIPLFVLMAAFFEHDVEQAPGSQSSGHSTGDADDREARGFRDDQRKRDAAEAERKQQSAASEEYAEAMRTKPPPHDFSN